MWVKVNDLPFRQNKHILYLTHTHTQMHVPRSRPPWKEDGTGRDGVTMAATCRDEYRLRARASLSDSDTRTHTNTHTHANTHTHTYRPSTEGYYSLEENIQTTRFDKLLKHLEAFTKRLDMNSVSVNDHRPSELPLKTSA